jgi:hypothetical protein
MGTFSKTQGAFCGVFELAFLLTDSRQTGAQNNAMG